MSDGDTDTWCPAGPIMHAKAETSPSKVAKEFNAYARYGMYRFLLSAIETCDHAINKYEQMPLALRGPEVTRSIDYWTNVRSGIKWLITMLGPIDPEE